MTAQHKYTVHFDEAMIEQLYRSVFHARLDYLEGILMSSFGDLKSTLDALVAAVGTIKTDVDGLLAKLAAVPAAGMSADQQAALDASVAQAATIAASLKAIDAEVNPPAPAAASPAPAPAAPATPAA